MLKGVNKQILEISNTESPYFEKIIFFVRPSGHSLSEEGIRSEAEKISAGSALRPPRAKRSAKSIASFCAYLLMGIGTGVALSYIIGYIF